MDKTNSLKKTLHNAGNILPDDKVFSTTITRGAATDSPALVGDVNVPFTQLLSNDARLKESVDKVSNELSKIKDIAANITIKKQLDIKCNITYTSTCDASMYLKSFDKDIVVYINNSDIPTFISKGQMDEYNGLWIIVSKGDKYKIVSEHIDDICSCQIAISNIIPASGKNVVCCFDDTNIFICEVVYDYSDGYIIENATPVPIGKHIKHKCQVWVKESNSWKYISDPHPTHRKYCNLSDKGFRLEQSKKDLLISDVAAQIINQTKINMNNTEWSIPSPIQSFSHMKFTNSKSCLKFITTLTNMTMEELLKLLIVEEGL